MIQPLAKAPVSPIGTAAVHVAVLLGYFVLATLLQVAAGAFESGLGGFEDEPSHLVSALMIRDWLASGAWQGGVGAALEYARDYYVHYPKVGIGQWPPVFHSSLAVWMLVMGTSTASVVAFLTLVTSCLAFLVFVVVRRPMGLPAGVLAGGLLLAVPIVQQCGASAMTELLIALLALLAVLAFGRYMDTGRARYALGFGALAAATILTKGSGLALAGVPPLAILFGRRFDLLRQPALWGAAAIAATAAPWYTLMLETNQDSWAGGGSPSFAYASFAAGSFAGWLPDVVGWAGLALVPVGMAWGLRHGVLHGRWLALVAWVPALVALHLVVPSSVEERHLAVLAPPLVIFASLGAGAVVRIALRRTALRGQRLEWTVAATIALVALFAIGGRRGIPRKDWRGWGTAAEDLVARGTESPGRLLIASDPVGEGLFVAGVAFAEGSRPGRMVLRASKVLANAGWTGRDYSLRFEGPDELDAYLRETGVGVVVIDESVRASRHWYAHMDQLVSVTQNETTGWVALDRWDIVRDGRSVPQALRSYWRRGWRDLPAPAMAFEDIHR